MPEQTIIPQNTMGNESVDPEALRLVMRHWPTGVTVVTSRDGTVIHGMTVNSFTSISLDPPVVHVALAINTRTNALVKQSGVFAVTLLSETQNGISDRFAGQLKEHEDRFAGLTVFTLTTGAPLIEGGLAHLDCRVRTSFEIGSTTVFFGDVVGAVERSHDRPLVYFNRLYRGLQK